MANNTRILGLQEQTTLSAGDYSVVDSVAGGTKRFDLGTLMDQVIADVPESVAEWLDQHPEATTTVQDGSITYQKLHSSTKQRLNNKLHRLVTAPVVTASDAYAAPPVALVVDGKSVQDGTPTPDAPVAIQSVESVGLAAAGVNLLNPAHFTDATWFYEPADNGAVTVRRSDAGSWDDRSYITMSGQFTITRSNPLGILDVKYYDATGTYISGNIIGQNVASGTFTPPSGTRYARVKVGNGAGSENYPFTTTLMMELGPTATPYQPYVGSTTAIPLDGHALRSLPDGTHDELRVDADGAVTLVQRVGEYTTPTDVSSVSAFTHITGAYRFYTSFSSMDSAAEDGGTGNVAGLCSIGYYEQNPAAAAGIPHFYAYAKRVYYIVSDEEVTDAASAAAWINAHPMTIQYKLAEPVEIPLGTVTLPSMPAPDLTAWASCTPATDIELDYERDVTIAVERIEAAIAELATN